MIVVVGDGFKDLYQIGHVRGLSAEAPIPIVDVTETQQYWGGAVNVAYNCWELGLAVRYLQPPNANYPEKNRLMVGNQQLARWDTNDWCVPLDVPGFLHPQIESTQPSMVIVSDYNKGTISPAVIEYLICTELPLLVDTKKDPKVWLGAKDVTLFPNLAEYKQFVDMYSWFPKVVLKQGALGMSWMEFGHIIYSVSAKAKQVVSVNGAGDTVIAAYATAFQRGEKAPLSFASVAAGLAVERPYTSTVQLEEVLERIKDED